VDLAALEDSARERLSRLAYDYFAGGAEDELTLADNVAAWARIRLRPRVLRDVSVVDTSTTVLGSAVAMPILVAPTAYQRLAHDEGEPATARAAAAAGTVLVTSTLATWSLRRQTSAMRCARVSIRSTGSLATADLTWSTRVP